MAINNFISFENGDAYGDSENPELAPRDIEVVVSDIGKLATMPVILLGIPGAGV